MPKDKILFSDGDTEVGAPAYANAYSVDQAKIIFKNVMEARIYDKQIPFIANHDEIDEERKGRCIARKDMMIWHMVHHQHIHPAAIGVALAKPKLLEESEDRTIKTANYSRRITHKATTDNSIQRWDDGYIEDGYDYHVAPTIKVQHEDGSIEHMVIDPALCPGPASFSAWGHCQHFQNPFDFLESKRHTKHEHANIETPIFHFPFDECKAHHIQGQNANPSETREYFNFFNKDLTCLNPNEQDQDRLHDLRKAIHKKHQSLRLDRAEQERSLKYIHKHHKELPPLPNCGPLALKAVLAHMQKELSEPPISSITERYKDGSLADKITHARESRHHQPRM